MAVESGSDFMSSMHGQQHYHFVELFCINLSCQDLCHVKSKEIKAKTKISPKKLMGILDKQKMFYPNTDLESKEIINAFVEITQCNF